MTSLSDRCRFPSYETAMSTITLTVANFEETLAKGGTLFIDFWASWCGPCKAFAPIFEAAAASHPDLVFAKVDTDAEQGLAQAFDIQGIPTLAVFRDGILLAKNAGALPAKALENVISQVRAVDMAEVKKKMSEGA
jgi:thioredoxin 1